MALIVEDGSGILGADSFLTYADAQTIATNYSLNIGDNEASAEANLRQGYSYLNSFETEAMLMGGRTHAVQSGIFPRKGCYLINMSYPFPALDDDAIPDDIKLAQVLAAQAFNDGMNAYGADTNGKVTEINVQGVYSERRDVSDVGQYPKVDAVYRILLDYGQARYQQRYSIATGQPMNQLYRPDMTYNGWGRL